MRERTKNKKIIHKIEHWKVIACYLLIYDIAAINFSYFFALWLRFDLSVSSIPREYLNAFVKFAPIYTVVTVIVFHLLHLYNSLWRFASFSELNRITIGTAIVTLFHIVGITEFVQKMPISYYVFGAMIQFILVVAVRFSYRYLTLERARRTKIRTSSHNAMVIGAGVTGKIIIKELRNSHKADARAVCIIDDNPNKWGRLLEGVPIVGGRESILDAAEKYHVDQILFAIPAASPDTKKEILNICKETGCELKSLPAIYQLTNGEVSLSKMRPVSVEDLLGRDPIKVNLDEILGYVSGKVVMVTGGGGSIGSELCRQLAGHGVKQLIIFDIYENNVYDIQQELKRQYPNLNLVALIGSVRNTHRINSVMEQYRPNIVYHAAAHKHVPLMESSPNEAIKNNVFGTYKTAAAAGKHHVEKFVLISTDKAVNPTNIMGASKRMCEMIVQTMNGYYKTDYVAVRFGNVLGSNGSVIPLFKKQIEEGGPVTVTDPNIIRYFMTIPEAVSLVLQAGAYAKGGEIFVLDMGEPVKIDDLARNLIQLSGLKVGRDIEIKYTGLRPGEKLYEELLMDEEGLQDTENKMIHIGKPIQMDDQIFMKQLKALKKASDEDSDTIRRIVKEIVPTYQMKENL